MSDGLANRAWRRAAAAISAAAAGATSWRPDVRGGVAVSTIADLGRSVVTAGVGIAQAPTRLVAAAAAGVAATPIIGGGHTAPQVAGCGVSTVGDLGRTAQVPAAEIAQITYDLVGTYNPAAATNAGAGSNAFTSPANALAPDGAVASHTGSATAATDARLDLTYAAASFASKDSLGIVKVELLFFTRQTGTTLGNGWLEHRLNGVTLGSIDTGNVDYTTTPQVYDVTAALSSWALIRAATAAVRHVAGLGVLTTVAVDVVQMRVTARTVQAT